MYKATFINDNGSVFLLGADGGNAFDMTGLSGHAVSMGLSQGYGQVGNTVFSTGVQGATLTVKGCIFRDIPIIKAQMMRAFAPQTQGRLIFGDFYLPCHVKAAPTVSPTRDNGTFTFQLYAPYPYFRRSAQTAYTIGGTTPLFSFPTAFTSFSLGSRSDQTYVNCVNSGDLPADFDLRAVVEQDGTGPMTITNMDTLATTTITGTWAQGTELHLYRGSDGILRLEAAQDGIAEDVFYALDDASNLFSLAVGDNLIKAESAAGLASYYLTINESVAGVYDGRA